MHETVPEDRSPSEQERRLKKASAPDQLEVEIFEQLKGSKNRKIKIVGTAAAIGLALGGLYVARHRRKNRR
jgi:hypothetical protein